jgi:hypothetical protein
VLHRDLGQADGRIVYCLPLNEERESMERILRSPLEDIPAAVRINMAAL